MKFKSNNRAAHLTIDKILITYNGCLQTKQINLPTTTAIYSTCLNSQSLPRCNAIQTLVMYPLLLSIVFAKLVTSNFLAAEANYHRPKSERSNIVNKGVWVRSKIGDNFEKTSLGELVFPPSDGDKLPSNFENDGENGMEEGHFVPELGDRSSSRRRRSPDQKPKRHARKSVRKVKTLNSIDDSKKVIPLLKSTPFDNSKKEDSELLVKALEHTTQATTAATTEATTRKAITEAPKITTEVYNFTESPEIDHPKRRRKHNHGTDNTNQLEVLADYKKENKTKTNRNVFDEDDRIWHQSVPIPDTNIYEVVPKEEVVIQEPAKGITEKGLIKVLSMLTKTFKKIMRQHHEVKRIYEKLNSMNEDFVKALADINTKFQDFDSKYSDMIQFNEKVKTFEDKIMTEEMYVKTKHKQMEDNMEEFENQQKKFLAQQKQFYTVQKVMLAQNEKINNKQITIAKTQSEISHKQNNFARILKKAKQMFVEKKNDTEKHEVKTTTEKVQTTVLPVTESAVKFNLFSIPTKTKLPYNQDEQIIKEKDERTVDDLVYKYYFNNTFIDNLMKSKILNDYASNTNSIEIARNVKNKREKLRTTVLLPVDNNDANNLDETSDTENNKRIRRWIAPSLNVANKALQKKDITAKDPFFTMATSFCNEIGQNGNAKILKRCVEKALRRLKFMGNKLFSKKQVTVMMEKKPQTLKKVAKFPVPGSLTTRKPTTIFPFDLSTLFLTTNMIVPSTPLYALPQGIFFPDNDELESNLKQYDLTPDTEGNVYYDGSLHLSDMNGVHDSGGMSDIMPGLADSNSKAEMNPLAFDLKAKRRAFVNKINEDIMRNMKTRKL